MLSPYLRGEYRDLSAEALAKEKGGGVWDWHSGIFSIDDTP